MKKAIRIFILILLFVVVLALLIYNYFGIQLLKEYVKAEQQIEKTNLVQKEKYKNEQDLIAIGIPHDRAKQINNNVKNQKYIKEVLNNQDTDLMQEILDIKTRSNKMLSEMKQLKWYKLDDIKKILIEL